MGMSSKSLGRPTTTNENLEMSHAHTQWDRMKRLVAETILLGALMGGSTMAGAGTVIIEEDLGAVERREGDGVHFALIRDGDLSSALTVDVYLSETGNMIGGKGTHSVTMPAEHDLGRLDVWTVDDDVPESASTISARVLPGTGYTVGSPSSSSVRVTDDDAGRSTTDITAVQHQITEGATAVFRISRTGDTQSALPLQVWIESDAVADANVGEVAANIPAGRTSTDLSIRTQAISRDGSVSAHVMQGTNDNVTYIGHAVVDVINAVTLSTVSFERATGTTDEGNQAEFVIERNPAQETALTVHYSVAVGTHTNLEAGTPTTGSVTIPARRRTAEVSIQTVVDGVSNPNGSITGRLMSNSAYRIGSPSAKIVTVRNRESFEPTTTLTLLSPAVSEGGTIRVRVNLDPAPRQAHTVEINVRESGEFLTAEAKALGAVTIPANQQSAIVGLRTVNDAIDEHHGTVRIALDADPSQVVTATVQDNDLPSIRFAELHLRGRVEGQTINFALEQSGIDLPEVTARVRVDYEGFSPAYQNIDVVFEAGKTSAATSVTLPDNATYSSTSGRFRMTVVRREGYSLGSRVDTGWIAIEDDDLINTTVSVAGPSSVTEGSTVTFTFSRSPNGASFPIWANHQIGWSDIGGWWPPVVNEKCYRVVFPQDSTSIQLRVPIQNDPYDLGSTRMIMGVSYYGGCTSGNRAGYSVSRTAGAKEVRIDDNDATNNPPQVYLTSGSAITEGQDIVARMHRTGSTNFPLTVGYTYVSTGDRVNESRGRRTMRAGEASTDITIATYRDAAVNESETITVAVDASAAFKWGHPGTGKKSSVAFTLHSTRDTSRDIVLTDTGSELGEVTLEHIGPVDTNDNVLSTIEEESNSNLELRLSRTRVTNSRIRVGIKATEKGAWLTAGAKTYWFDMAPNETTKDIEIELVNDGQAEENGSVTVELLASDNYNVAGTLQYTVTVTDNDAYFLIDKNYFTPGGYNKEFEVREGNDAEVKITLINGRDNLEYLLQWYTRVRPFQATPGVDFAAQHLAQEISFPAKSGERTATISVRTISDYPLDDDGETFAIYMQSRSLMWPPATANFKWADGAYYESAAHGFDIEVRIRNDGAMPNAWMLRFGRTVGSQVVDALTQRLDGGGASHVTVAGINITGGAGTEAEIEDDPFGLPVWAKNAEREAEGQTISADDILLQSAFHLSSAGDGTHAEPSFTVWGRVATGGFEAVEDGVAIDGDVTTGFIGFDAEWERALAGVMLSQSKGEGSYGLDRPAGSSAGNGSGTIESSLTGVYPYARVELNAKVSAWALAGAGSGELTLHHENRKLAPADISMRMGAVGVKGQVLDGGGPSGLGLNVKSDAMWVGTKSERTNDMAASEGDVTRMRLIIEGERIFEADNGATFIPSAEIGLRHDGGDAETGTGVEVGAGLRYTIGTVTIEAKARTLIAHEAAHYEEWGASGAIRIAPSASGRGLTLSIAPAWGRTESATERLWSAHEATTLGTNGEFEADARLAMDAGYGFGLTGNRGVLTPYAGLALGDDGNRTGRAGTRWQLSPDTVVSIEATREASDVGESDNELMLRTAVRF